MGENIWRGWNPGEYQVHFIHTGVAESVFHIFPDGTTMLTDCGDHPALTRLELSVPVIPNPGRLAGDWIARYVKRTMPRKHEEKNGLPLVDYFLLSHFHDDHCGSIRWQTSRSEGTPLPGCYRSGLALAAEQLSFDTALDRGWPDYSEPRPNAVPSGEFDHMQRIYTALKQRDNLKVEKFRVGAVNQIAMKHCAEPYPDFQITNICCNGKILRKDGSIRDLYADHIRQSDSLNENGMSAGVLIRYGKFTLFSAGDFSDTPLGADGKSFLTEDIFAEELPHVEAAKINHHGYYSMTEKMVKALSPQIWTACVWDQLHVLDVVLERLSDRTIYPGGRMIFPTVFPAERCAAAKDKPFFSDIAEEVREHGSHVVITVQPGGESYRVSCITAEDETMRVKGEYEFTTRS